MELLIYEISLFIIKKKKRIEETWLWRRVVATRFGEEWGDGLLSWVGVCMVVVYEEIFKWVRRHLAIIICLRLGWGID